MTLHERNGVSNYRRIGCLFKGLWRLTPKKTSKLRIAGPLWEESTDGFPHRGQVTQKRYPCHGAFKNCRYDFMTSSNGNIFRVTGTLCGEFTGHRWIPLTKASDAELWYLFDMSNNPLSKQSWGWWFGTPSHSLWRHCNYYSLDQLSKCCYDMNQHWLIWNIIYSLFTSTVFDFIFISWRRLPISCYILQNTVGCSTYLCAGCLFLAGNAPPLW